ncbi:MAG: hypothetical protein V3V00_08485 [Saprospiraceae bacterium]
MKDEDKVVSFELLGLTFFVKVNLFFRLVPIVWIAELILLFISIFFFNYEMTNADMPGGLISGVLLAYLIHLLIE